MPTVRAPLAVIALFALIACEWGGSPAGSAPITLRHPPERPADAAPPDGEGAAVFAIDSFVFPSAASAHGTNGWATLGFDLDGVATATRDAPGPCRLAAGASSYAQLDGDDGIDNSFGHNVWPILAATFGADLDIKLNTSFGNGDATNLIVVDHLVLGRDAWPLTAQLLLGAPLGVHPTWSPDDAWPVDRTSIDARGTALVYFAGSYVSGRTLVGAPASGQGYLSIGNALGMRLVAPITRVQFTVNVAPDGSGGANGVLGGILPVQDLLAEVRRLFEERAQTWCSPSVREPIEAEFLQAADILVDGSIDPSRPCDGVSVGLGFTVKRIARGPVVDVPEPPNQCASP